MTDKTSKNPKKPLGRKNYGSIGHLPQSRMGPADHCITEGQAKIACEKGRDRHDVVIVQEKLDGSNVGVALVDGVIHSLGRSGYTASSSPHEQHHQFARFVRENEDRFRSILNEGERICGEWLYMAHGTKYDLPHEPFVAFDLIDGENTRAPFADFCARVGGILTIPHTISNGAPISIEQALSVLGEKGYHGATEQVEGLMWRVERRGVVDYLCKYVRPEKIDGKYFGDEPVINTWKDWK